MIEMQHKGYNGPGMAKRTGTADLPLHRGKDGHPYPVDRKTYDQSIALWGPA